MALALYRRYRPDTFAGVIGQDQVTVPLMRALDEGKLTHAYLFSGPRGCGKTSSARILARCINCAQGPTSHPCGECESCRDLTTGGPGSIDVVEIDAASHNGVDDARELRERAGFAPARDRYKIFILDEAHMVTQQGFNALLKIVEEPPEHVMFIFATTEPDKVIGTIRSRTHHYPFRLVPAEVMGPYLEDVCAKEGVTPEPGVLRLAMRAGGGSMRDTLSVLDQLMVGAVDGTITHDASVALLGFTPDALIGDAVDAVIDRDGAALYAVVQKVVVGGFDPRRFVEDLLARVRDLLVLTLAGERAGSVLSEGAEAEDTSDLQRQASALGLAELTSMAETINTTLGSMTGAISPRMRLELLAARLLAARESGAAGAAGAPGVADGPTVGPGMSVPSGSSVPSGGKPGMVAPGGFAGSQSPTGGFAGAAGSPTGGFAGAMSPSDAAASRPSAGGFAGAVAAAAAAASAGATGIVSDDGVGAGHAAGAAQSSAAASPSPQPSTPAAARPAADDRTPDQRWDALVAALPEDVRRYIDRSRVPKILLAPDKDHAGRYRLWMKFDRALSKYAFALAVSREPVDGTTQVVSIVRNEVHRVFGPTVTIAPTDKLADDSVAPPFSKLPPDEQQRVKSQLLQESLQSAVAKTSSASSATAGSASGAAASSSASDDTAADDDDVHRAAGPSSVAADSDDPWASPAVVSRPAVASSADGSPSHPAKHVAVPDPSDTVDPWATPASSAVPAPAVVPAPADPWTQVPPPDDDPWESVQPIPSFHTPQPTPSSSSHAQPFGQRPGMPAAGGPGFPGGPAGPAGPGMPGDPAMPSAPQVDPDEDEYSMSDESLGTAGTMTVDELKKFFDVKKVEEFAAGDPKNPRNLAKARRHDD